MLEHVNHFPCSLKNRYCFLVQYSLHHTTSFDGVHSHIIVLMKIHDMLIKKTTLFHLFGLDGSE